MIDVRMLRVKEGLQRGTIYPVHEGTVSIGRDSCNEIVIADVLVSRRHARISRTGEDLVIEDLGSVNGTRVNDRAMTRQILKPGDEISLGATVLQLMPRSFSAGMGERRDTLFRGARLVSDEETFSEATVRLTIPSNANNSLTEVSPGSDDFREVRIAYQRLDLVYQLFRDFAALRPLPELLHRGLERVLEILGADWGTILLLNGRGEMVPEAVCMRREPHEQGAVSVSKTITRRALESDQSILTSDALTDKRFQGSESIQLHKIRSTMCAPIKGQEKKLGVIYLDTRERLLGFTREDLELFTVVTAARWGSSLKTRSFFPRWNKRIWS
jgi:hypothetical protein